MERRKEETRKSVASDVVGQWLEEVSLVLQKPAVALALFMLRIVFFIIACKQTKMLFDFIEAYGYRVLEGDSVLSYFLMVIVFFFMWMDMVIVRSMKLCGALTVDYLGARFGRVRDYLERLTAREEYKRHRNLTLPRRYNLRKRRPAHRNGGSNTSCASFDSQYRD